jgi:hypothetical protein
MSRVLRTLRQKRLREVGEAGQARLFAASARVESDRLRGEFAVRYLVGAGVTQLEAPAALHPAALAIDAGAQLAPCAEETRADAAPDFMLEPAAREAFSGALDALCIIRGILAS